MPKEHLARRIEGIPSCCSLWAAILLCVALAPASAADQPQWGERFSRNMVSPETGLPETCDPATGRNVRWTAPLGRSTYSTAVVASGRVLVGTDNDRPRDARHAGDRAVLLCLDEKDGHLLWQLTVPKRGGGDPFLDWPHVGIVSPPTVEGERVYVPTNRGEVLCLDLQGQANGNQGPFLDEARFAAPEGEPPVPVGPTDADILWRCDLIAEAGIYTHDSVHASILIHGPWLYLNSCNGVDNTHRGIRAPEAPSLVALEKATGRIVSRDGERIGPRILHNTWSSPALGEVAGRALLFFGGGDGVLYAFDALPPRDPPAILERVWRLDCDPAAPKENTHEYQGNRNEGPSNFLGMPVFHDGRVYVVAGGDIWQGKRAACLKCIDPRGTGDRTRAGEVWSYPIPTHSGATPSVQDDLVYVTDARGTLHCVDAESGRACWTHAAGGETWGSTLVADGRVYFGTRRGELWILAAGREKRVIASVRLDAPISGTPTAANGVLYVTTARTLWALAPSAVAEGRWQ